jgi:hypothetical protein
MSIEEPGHAVPIYRSPRLAPDQTRFLLTITPMPTPFAVSCSSHIMSTAFPLIFRLPEALMLFIFSFCGPAAFADELMKPPRARDHWWTLHRSNALVVTQICVLWRRYALGCGALWSVPILDNSKLYPLMLERAQTTPLTIRYPPYQVNLYDDSGLAYWKTTDVMFPSIIEEVLQAEFHVRELALSSQPLHLDNLLSHIDAPSHSLETLRIDVLDSTSAAWQVPDRFLQLFPRIRQLHCRSCIPPVPFFHGSRTTLVIHHTYEQHEQHRWGSHGVSLSFMLDLLRQTRTLRSITLKCTINVGSVPATPLPTLCLPNLRHAVMEEHHLVIAAFLRCLRLRPEADLVVRTCIAHDDTDTPSWKVQCTEDETRPFLETVHRYTERTGRARPSRAIFGSHHQSY